MDSRRDQQGFFTYLHKWIVIVKQRSQLDDIALIIGNVSNVMALAPSTTTHHIEQVGTLSRSTIQFVITTSNIASTRTSGYRVIVYNIIMVRVRLFRSLLVKDGVTLNKAKPLRTKASPQHSLSNITVV